MQPDWEGFKLSHMEERNDSMTDATMKAGKGSARYFSWHYTYYFAFNPKSGRKVQRAR